jgi:hypothetical protein
MGIKKTNIKIISKSFKIKVMKNENYSFYVKATFFSLNVLNIFFVVFEMAESICKPIYNWLIKCNIFVLIGIIFFSIYFFIDWFWMEKLGIPVDSRVWPISFVVIIFDSITIKALRKKIQER